MGILIFSLVLFVIFIFIALFLALRIKRVYKTKKGYLLFAVTPIAFIILLFGAFTKVGANEVGIIYNDTKGVLDTVKYEGFQSKSIFDHITTISTANKTANVESSGQTVDSAYATFIITIVYAIEKDNAGKFFKKTSNTDISKEQLNSMVKESLQANTIRYDIYQLLGEDLDKLRIEFTGDLSKNLLDRYYITLISTSFDDVDAGSRIEEIIKNKAEALQQIQIAEAEKQKAVVEAETAKVKAEANAAVVQIQAEAEAKKVEIEKTAVVSIIDGIYQGTKQEDGSYLLTYKQCAEIVLKQIYYDKWDGQLPYYLGSGDVSVILPEIGE